MKKYNFSIIITFFSLISFSQKYIELYPEKVNLENCKFYITKVVDKRNNKDFIGEYTKDSLVEKIDFKDGA